MSIQSYWELLFWGSFVVLLYTFIGYPLLIRLLSRTKTISRTQDFGDWPAITVLLATHKEENRIVDRISNLFDSDYEKEKISIVVVDDASQDETPARLEGLHAECLTVIRNETRRGKAACLSQGMQVVDTEFVVFADARQKFAKDAIPRLVARLSQSDVGAVSGGLVLEEATGNVGKSVNLYWKLEKWLRQAESDWDSCIGCTGAIYAIRKTLFKPIPPDTLLDDVVIPMQISMQGYRVLYDGDAIAIDPQASEAHIESKRKRRTLAGNFQMLFRYPSWLSPWKNRLWWQLISHKYLRILAPVFLFSLFLSNIFLAAPFYRVILIFHCLFYFLAIIGMAIPALKSRIVSIPAGFVFLNLASVGGFMAYMGNSYQEGWKKT